MWLLLAGDWRARRRLRPPRGKRSLARKSAAVSQAIHTSVFLLFVCL
ncbi:hypothetical protein [Priestia megaterium]|nr:hypothetical protein [Priestia megaterium]MDR7246024.1 hypothetical protein [Priestia megaterium]